MNQLFLALCLLALTGAPLLSQGRNAPTKETIDLWMKELSNWGRWGPGDQLGALNLITPAKRRQAAALVREGVSVSLAHDVIKEKAADAPSPFRHVMVRTGQNNPTNFSIDEFSVLYHGYAHTHVDSLCHMFYKGRMYNGFSQELVTASGAQALAVENLKNGIFSRGILMDIPALEGVPFLEPGTAIMPEQLDAWEKRARLKVSAGDIVFIRTGRWALRAQRGPAEAGRIAGLHASCARWLKSRDVAMLGSDAASDVMPSGIDGVTHPIHQLALVAMGMPIFDNCDLEQLSREAAKRKRWEFLLTAAPLAVTGGTGSPLNPIATF